VLTQQLIFGVISDVFWWTVAVVTIAMYQDTVAT